MRSMIEIDQVSKMYRLGLVGTGTLTHDLNRWWHRVQGLEDPYTKIAEVNDRSTSKGADGGPGSDYVWALRDVSLDIRDGEIFGIVGANGAGKSTLLKLLSRVTAPTSGRIRAAGRISSLLEVGTGFHPELTGRENVYLNGAILGMSRREISARLDSIVEFSGCARYIDTPVKRYSSGMTVRLGFSVAAHLDAEILVVDEVLAVGDAQFQKLCIEKMREMSTSEGRTVLLVSHNMGTISSLCTRAALMAHGSVAEVGPVDEVVLSYLAEEGSTGPEFTPSRSVGDEEAQLIGARIRCAAGEIRGGFDLSEAFEVEMEYELLRTFPFAPYPNFHVLDEQGNYAFVSNASERASKEPGRYLARCRVPAGLLNDGIYRIGVALTSSEPELRVHFWEREALSVSMSERLFENIEGARSGYAGRIPGVVRPVLEWSVDRLEEAAR